jgi:(p)ppGpp synthase/HD superfamily hydrolase
MNTPTMQLLSLGKAQGPDVTRDLANAITLAQRVHRGQFRRSGDPYITHPIAVALIVADYGADPTTVITAVLHDLQDVSTQDAAEGLTHDTALRTTFGVAIVDLLAEVTALERSGPIPSLDTTDRRALAIKVADRLHNMRTIRHLLPEKQQRKATHTSAVVAPLARRLGMTAIGDELGTLSAATLRAHDESQRLAPQATTAGAPRTVSFRALHNTLRAAVRVLPAHCRARWIQEWEGELCAAADFQGRLRFAADVLRGLPTMAVLTRRMGPR